MGADEHRLFWKVIIPGASPFIITGMRQAFLRAWIAVVGAEMIARLRLGSGLGYFRRQRVLNTDTMLASLIVIGIIGFVFERFVFGSLEQHDCDAVGAWYARQKASAIRQQVWSPSRFAKSR